MRIKVLNKVIGAEITGMDLSHPINTKTKNKLRELMLKYQIIVFRKQHIDEKKYIDFSKIFGKSVVCRAPSKHPDHPHISVISNLKDVGDSVQEGYWHSDGHYAPKAYRYVILYSKIVPKRGGDTLYANLRLAYAKLPEELKRMVKGKRILYEHFKPEEHDPISHPILRINHYNHSKALYVMPGGAITIKGMPTKQGKRLINELIKHATQPAFVYKHKWRKGDILIWDNLSVLHAATAKPKSPRVLYRLHLY